MRNSMLMAVALYIAASSPVMEMEAPRRPREADSQGEQQRRMTKAQKKRERKQARMRRQSEIEENGHA
ncbi:hypothetical protein [Pseudomonas pseudonitroreducens]|uniref:hypothetical protein n=1 Tax=Pseudomonas pseudonitroreducens TaxID=2892326 RepID=UPI001F43250F|nr:hypothetical protein [Pseudomonas pseudonitroreducens]